MGPGEFAKVVKATGADEEDTVERLVKDAEAILKAAGGVGFAADLVTVEQFEAIVELTKLVPYGISGRDNELYIAEAVPHVELWLDYLGLGLRDSVHSLIIALELEALELEAREEYE